MSSRPRRTWRWRTGAATRALEPLIRPGAAFVREADLQHVTEVVDQFGGWRPRCAWPPRSARGSGGKRRAATGTGS